MKNYLVLIFIFSFFFVSYSQDSKTKCFTINRSNKIWHEKDSTTKISNNTINKSLKIISYPNPSSENITFEIIGLNENNINAKIYDNLANLIYDFSNINLINNQFTWEMKNNDFVKVSNGVYFLKITGNKINFSYKFIINNN